MPAGRPPLYETPEAFTEKVKEYFANEVSPENPPTITGLALYLGFDSRQSFYDYEEREAFSYTVKRARTFIENEYEKKLHGNSCTGAIFALKNMGWKDKTEQEIHGALPVTINETRNYTRPNETTYQHK